MEGVTHYSTAPLESVCLNYLMNIGQKSTMYRDVNIPCQLGGRVGWWCIYKLQKFTVQPPPPHVQNLRWALGREDFGWFQLKIDCLAPRVIDS